MQQARKKNISTLEAIIADPDAAELFAKIILEQKVNTVLPTIFRMIHVLSWSRRYGVAYTKRIAYTYAQACDFDIFGRVWDPFGLPYLVLSFAYLKFARRNKSLQTIFRLVI